MFLDETEKYTYQYENGIKKISFRSSRPKVLKEPIHLTLEKSHGNYDLYFNRKGLLLHSFHNENQNKYKIIYGYNPKGILLSVFRLVSETNELKSISEFYYDKKGRVIKEIVRSNGYFDNTILISKRIHKYKGNEHTMLMTSNDGEEDATFIDIFDDKGRIIEVKAIRGKSEMIYWEKKEFDTQGNLIKRISLNEKGEPEGVTEYYPTSNNLYEAYKYISKDLNYQHEYFYTYNEKGHLINEVRVDDGEPRYICDRIIEYY